MSKYNESQISINKDFSDSDSNSDIGSAFFEKKLRTTSARPKVRAGKKYLSHDEQKKRYTDHNISLRKLRSLRIDPKINPNKVAIIATGRWQPPHIGHSELINTAYSIAKYMEGTCFINIAGEVINASNPLSIEDRLYYLKKMYPISQYNIQRFDFITEGNFTDKSHDYRSDPRGERTRTVKYGEKFTGIINMLKQKKGYELIIIVSGSDRFEKFKKLNRKSIIAGEVLVEDVGGKRREVGAGGLSDSSSVSDMSLGFSIDGSSSDSESDVDSGLSKIQRYANAVRGIINKRLDDKLKKSQGSVSGLFSGSKMRDYAFNAGIEFKRSIRIKAIQKFKMGCKIGDMTDNDCLELLNLVREGMSLPVITNWPYGISDSVNIEIKRNKMDRVSRKLCNSFNASDGLIPIGFYGKKARKQCKKSGCSVVRKKNNRTRCQKFRGAGKKRNTTRKRKYNKTKKRKRKYLKRKKRTRYKRKK